MLLTAATSLTPFAAEPVLRPQIDGPWWTVSGNPDLGKWTSEKQQPVDFGVWRAADGSWQLWSCIRATKCGGNTRLFYRWEGARLTDPDWRPMGIAMTADPNLDEAVGGLQAPHVIHAKGQYQMFYGNWHGICLAVSKEGKEFNRFLTAPNTTQMFTDDAPDNYANTRDAMVLEIDGVFHCYYTAFPNRLGAVYCRTSRDLKNWSASKIVSFGGRAGTGPTSAECPHVIYRHGWYYLFRTQRYGQGMVTSVYRSKDPMNFGVEDDRWFVSTLPVAAPEIIHHEGEDYIASLLPNLKGIQIARLKWKPAPVYKNLMDFDNPAVRRQWKVIEGKIDPLFTTSTRHRFQSRSRHFIGTAESARGGPDDSQVGVIESPDFTLKEPGALLLVSGGKDSDRVHVAILDAGTGQELVRYSGNNDNTLRERPLDSALVTGKKMRIRIVDRSTDGWGHINFGGIFTRQE